MDILKADFSLLSDDAMPENQFKGMAIVFGSYINAKPASMMHKGAFTKTLQESGRKVKILWQHDDSEPIGVPVNLYESDNGLVVEFKVSDTSRGRDAITLLNDGVADALSIGFDVIKADYETLADGTRMRHIREVRLWEISVVTWGADPKALIGETYGRKVMEKRGVQAFKNLPLAKAELWNAKEAEARVREWSGCGDKPNAKYTQAFAYVDPENDSLSGCKYLLGDVVNGKLAVVPQALCAAAAKIHFTETDNPELDSLQRVIERYFDKAHRESFSNAVVPWFMHNPGHEEWSYYDMESRCGYLGSIGASLCVDEHGDLTSSSLVSLVGLKKLIEGMLVAVESQDGALTPNPEDDEYPVDYSAFDEASVDFEMLVAETRMTS